MAQETRVRSLVATHLLTSLNLPGPSLAADSNWIPVTLVAEDGLEARAGRQAPGEEDCVTGTLKHGKSSVARSSGIVLRRSSVYGAGGYTHLSHALHRAARSRGQNGA